MGSLGEDAPLIYGLEFQARALAAQSAETEVTRFFVGTQTLNMANNQIHVVELNDETGALYTQVYGHPCGEVWWLQCSPHDPGLFSSVYNCLVEEEGSESCKPKAALWRLPSEPNCDELTNVVTLPIEDSFGGVKSTLFHPIEENKIASICESKFAVWDLNDGGARISTTGSVEGKGHQKMYGGKWNPQDSLQELATAQESMIKGWDLRIGSSITAWTIENAHAQQVRDIDYNRNRQFYLASCGDDAGVRLWDIRKPNSAVVSFTAHSHWVWCIRYNLFHDQLLASGSSDARVILFAVSSISSEPDTGLGDDGILQVYDHHHEDSVYALEWSAVDPWTLASLSYDGRLLVSRVPKVHKYKILGI